MNRLIHTKPTRDKISHGSQIIEIMFDYKVLNFLVVYQSINVS